MNEQTPALIEITREAPCDGRREELLSLVALRADAPRSAAVRRHARNCRRCAAFLASVQGELRLTRDAFGELQTPVGQRDAHDLAADTPEADTALAALPSSRKFDRWIEQQLKRRSELDLAEAMTRTARWLFRIEPDIAARVAAAGDEPPSTVSLPPSAAEHAAELQRRLAWRDSVSRGCGRKSVRQSHSSAGDNGLFDEFRKLLVNVRQAKVAHRNISRSFIDRAHELAAGQFGGAWLMSSLIDWCWGDAASVDELLRRAAACDNPPNTAASILLNTALRRAERTLGTEVLDLLARALACGPSVSLERVIRMNRVLWNHSLARFEHASRDIAAIHRNSSAMDLREHFGVESINRILSSLATRHELPKSRRTLAIRKTIEAFHVA